MDRGKTYDQLLIENENLRQEVNEARDILESIRKGEVDAFIVKSEDRHELYTLKSADKTYRIFIEKMSEGAMTVGKDGIIFYCNSSFAHILGIPLENLIGIALAEIIPDAYISVVNEIINEAWLKGESKAEIILAKKDKPLPVLLSLNRIEIDDNVVLSIIATDLSLQKETQTQKKAMEKKDEFISIASHELKTPVTSIKGYIQILRFNFQKEGNNAAAEVLSKVDTQVNKLTTLIGDLLDVKKIETGQLQLHKEHFDFNILVKEIIEETGRVLDKHSIKEILSNTKTIYGDRNKIGQVITNFIDNAGKYSPVNSDILVSTSLQNGKIKLSVKDFGIGIPKDQQSKIFERFFRVNYEKENTYAGLGLGLYISSELIRRHEGNIGVLSEEGQGSTFYFELPIAS
ncbi:sensor histidine kinase [Ferruginibacter albus]|uniref:sensor histidine kinase n=1 Tax=Ferruginibacter albus TaxID=2875540 RepID=UPI001CC7879A|nr:PAS domain-containing sensor histidine kinase [Ferruginibacter albus]UAY50820.1 PAS domain-containing sensor histidine kinase [Ferruginibacter albus]